jgi:hypothetical protein
MPISGVVWGLNIRLLLNLALYTAVVVTAGSPSKDWFSKNDHI